MARRPELQPQSAQLMQWLAHFCLEHQRVDDALALLQAMDALGVRDAHSLALLAQAYQRADRPTLALQMLERINEGDLNHSLTSAVHLIRAQVLLSLERKDEARDAMQRYMRLRRRGMNDHKERP